MFCENCGNKIKDDNKFCTECGNSTLPKAEKRESTISHDKWYLRFARVVYIILYVPLPFALIGVWTENDPYSSYDYFSDSYKTYGSYSDAFWYSLLTLVIWVAMLRLLKIATLYVVIGQKPRWKKEFKKLF